jgi:hypothetical protein
MLFVLIASTLAFAETEPLPSISDKTESMEALPGLFPMYWEETTGHLYLEVSRWEEAFLYVGSLTAGLGSNDIGLDRNQLGATRIVRFERIGPKILLIESNFRYRADTENAAERRAVDEAFAASVVWGFEAQAEEGERVLVDVTAFMLRDAHRVGNQLKNSKQGTFKVDDSRSAIFLPRTKNFDRNTEMESILTFTGTPERGAYVNDVAADSEAVTLRQHHSFVELPDDGYEPRVFDPRAGLFEMTYADYATPIGESLEKRFISRHRLNKRDPNAAISDPVEPIVYYLDPGTPEPVRSALLEGARWWNEAYEAAGYRDAFRVEMLPDDADPMDVRYNVINWVHRATRGWSYGSSVVDPRTGEIIKGHVTLGSLRVRQDYLIAQGLVPSFADGNDGGEALLEFSLARLRQLSAHEVGHTLGLAHNFASSVNNRASVMDYPHPLVTLASDGTLDLSNAYDEGIGDWDKATIAYAYQDFPEGTNEADALRRIILDAHARGLQFISDRDARAPGGAHPDAHLWENGRDATAELRRIMEVRAVALENFSAANIPDGTAMSTLEDVLVPVYLFHRYQTEAAAKVLGGVRYTYAMKGDGQTAIELLSGDDQREALTALLETISAEALTLDEQILALIPPTAYGHPNHRELFDGRTSVTLDPVAMAETAADMTAALLFHPARLARLVEHHARDERQPSLPEVIEAVRDATWFGPRLDGLQGEVQRAVNNVFLKRMLRAAADKRNASQVKAILEGGLIQMAAELTTRPSEAQWGPHYQYGSTQIARYLERPNEFESEPAPEMPPGSPIGMESRTGHWACAQ